MELIFPINPKSSVRQPTMQGLKPGDAFEYKGNYYMALSEFRGVRLYGGLITQFSHHDEVTPYTATVSLTKKF